VAAVTLLVRNTRRRGRAVAPRVKLLSFAVFVPTILLILVVATGLDEIWDGRHLFLYGVAWLVGLVSLVLISASLITGWGRVLTFGVVLFFVSAILSLADLLTPGW
jgi:hypothetical protein